MKRRYLYRLLLGVTPIILLGTLVLAYVRLVLVPADYQVLLKHKKELLREITSVTIQSIDRYYQRYDRGELSRQEAMALAKDDLNSFRWHGTDNYYFYAFDLKGFMLVHPMKHELVHKSSTNLKDENGIFIVRNILASLKKNHEAFTHYSWYTPSSGKVQHEQMTYSRIFTPWGWVINTGASVDDIKNEFRRVTSVADRGLGILGVVSILMIFLVLYISLRSEKETEKTEMELEAAETKFYDIFSNTFHFIGLLDEKGILIDANQTSLAAIGTTLEEEKGKPFWETSWWSHDEEQKKQLREAIRRSGDTGIVSRFDAVHYAVDGTPIISDFVLKPLFDGKTVRRYIAEGTDVTEQRLMEEQFQHAQKMESIGHLAGGVAHDFNNVLGGILGASELLKKEVASEKGGRLLEMIINASRQASNLTGKLLAFARKDKIDSTAININDLLQECISILEHTIDKKISISQDLSSDLIYTVGDPTQIQNAIINIGINASHAIEGEGEILFSTAIVELSPEYISRSVFDLSAGSYAEVCIADTGSGIAPHNMAHIFDPFFTTKEQGLGTGLGLAAVYAMVKQHQGEVTVSSKLRKGSTFCIHLPLKETFISPTARSSDLVSGTGMVLLVDDEEILRTTTEIILADLGYSVLTAENGRLGLELFKEHYSKIDLVLMDMMMPEMNGREAFLAMREIDSTVPVILASGFAQISDIQDLKEKGLVGHIRKPFGELELSRVVNSFIKRSNGSQDEINE